MLIGLVGPFVFYFGGIGYYNVMSANMEGYDVFSQTLGNMWFWLAVPLISALSVLPTWLYFFISSRYFPSVRCCACVSAVSLSARAAVFAQTARQDFSLHQCLTAIMMLNRTLFLHLRTELQEDEKVLQVQAEQGDQKAIEESNRRKLPLELPMPPSFSSLCCKPMASASASGSQQP